MRARNRCGRIRSTKKLSDTRRRSGTEEGAEKLKTFRRLGLMLIVMMLMLLPMATSAYASGFDAAEDFAYYLWQYYGW